MIFGILASIAVRREPFLGRVLFPAVFDRP